MGQHTTQCPNCGTVFRVTDEQLQIANGSVRCGSCMHIFDARNPTGLQTPEQPAQDTYEPEEPRDTESEPARAREGSSKSKEDDVLSDSFLELDNWQEKNYGKFGDEEDKLELESRSSDSDEQWAKNLLDELDDPMPTSSAENRSGALDLDGSAPGRRANLPEDEPTETGSRPEAQFAETATADETVFDFAPEMAESDEPFGEREQPPADDQKQQKQQHDPFDFQGFDDGPDVGDELVDDFSREQIITAIEPAPLEFHITDDRRKWILRGLWVLLISAGIVTLITQIAWFNFEQKARDPEYRGWYQVACSLVGCKLPPQRDISAIKASNLVVRSHPKIKGALVVDAILTNSAGFNQAFPALELIFTNIKGQPVAARRFLPGEYLHGEMSGAKQLLTQRPVHISLEIIDPGQSAVNYSLQLHQI